MKLLILPCLLALGGVAVAQNAPDPLSPGDLVNPTSTTVQGAGVKVGEGTVIHPVVGVESGVVSNVFFEETGEANLSGLLRVLIELSAGSLSSQRLGIYNRDATDASEQSREAGSFQYLASAYAAYDQYLSGDETVRDAGGLAGGLLFKGVVKPQETVSFSFLEHFDRVVRATNFESGDNTNRDVNQLALRLNFQPRGRTLGGYLYYRNTIDYFERDNQQFANRFQNTIGVRANYQWLPLTRVYLDTSIGYFTGLGSESRKIDAYPLEVAGGIMTALSLNLTLNGRIGYTKGFYVDGPDYGTVTGGLQLGYRYGPRGRATLLYNYDHQDSINANFYRDHTIKLGIDQQFPPFAINVAGELRFRRYQGINGVTGVMGTGDIRDDVVGAINAGARYQFRDWIAAVANYQFAVVETDFRYDSGGGVMDDPSFLRHLLMVGVRAAY
jgi:hypothetical protein